MLGSCCCCAIGWGYFFGNPPYVGNFESPAADNKVIKLNTTKDNGVYTDEAGVGFPFKLTHVADKKSISLSMNDGTKNFWNGKSSVDLTYTDGRTLVGDGKTFNRIDPPINPQGNKKTEVKAPDANKQVDAEAKKDDAPKNDANINGKDAEKGKKDLEKTTK